MRILVVSDRYPPYYEGGYEIVCEVTSRWLAARGHDVRVLTSSFGLPAPVRETNVFRLLHPLEPNLGSGPGRRARQVKNAGRGRLNFRITADIIDEIVPDLVFVWRMGHVSIFPVIAATRKKIPVVYAVHDYWLKKYLTEYGSAADGLKGCLKRWLFGGTALGELHFANVLTVSEFMKTSYRACGIRGENIRVIPNSVHEGLLVAADAPARNVRGREKWRLLYAGRLVEEKGVHVAIAAVKHLVTSMGLNGIHLDIVGSGGRDYLARLEEAIDAARLRDFVTIREQVPRDDLLQRYGDYDAFLFPSVWEEPFGITILEAMAKGVPVIASKVGGVPEIVEDGENGLLVAPEDPVALAEAIGKLVGNPALWAKMRLAALQTVGSRFSQARCMELTEQYLLSVADSSPAAHPFARSAAEPGGCR